jgi:RimJ/RimL family protein N-acetyltransferase
MSIPGFPPLQLTDRVVTLRPWAAADAPDLYAAVRESYLVLTRWLPWADHYQSAQDAEHGIADGARRLKAGTEFRYGIFDAKTDFCLGGVGLSRINPDDKIANLGYWVRTSASKHGTATRAARLLARHALTDGPFHRIEIITAVENHPSHKVARKLGAKFEGILRDRIWIRSKAHDAHVYSLVRTDPIARSP